MEMNQTFCYCPVIKNLQQTSTTSTNGYFDSTSTRDKLIVIDALIKVASKFGLSDDEINIFLAIIECESGYNLFAQNIIEL